MPEPNLFESSESAVSPCSNVSVVIVSFNTCSKLQKCLECLDLSLEVIVVDNHSEDGSPEMVESLFPQVHLIRNPSNRGFGPANNQGSDISNRPLVLYLNSDAYAGADAIARLSEMMLDPTIVCAGGRLLNPDGSVQNSSANRLTLWAVFCEQTLLEKLLPESRWASPYWNTRSLLARGGPQDTAQVMGAAMMCRRGLERFDERFFLYCEDTDLCRRLSEHGRIVYVPDAEFVHDLGSSSSKSRWLAVARYNRGKELYFEIHHGKAHAFACLGLDRIGALLRLLGGLIGTVFTLGQVAACYEKAGQFARVLIAPRAGPTRY